jgi:hypothetical protein
MRLLALMAALSLSGCSMYIQHPLNEPLPPGTDIRAHLTTPGAVRVSGILGAPTELVEGRILALDRDSLQLALLITTEYGRPWEESNTLGLATSEISRLEEKKIDGKRTALLVGGVGAVSGVVVGALFRAATRTDDGEGGEEDLSLIPLFTIFH